MNTPSGTLTKPKVYVNGVETGWQFGKAPVWPKNRLARFIHRRILKRPPLRYELSANVIEVSVVSPAGAPVAFLYPVTFDE